MLYVKFGKNRPHSFRGDVVWKCWPTTTDGRRMPAYTISSPMSLRLRWAKKCLPSLIIYIFFHDLIHVYSRQPPGDKILMSTERPYHFTHLLQVSKKSLWSLILYNFFHDLIHVYSPGAGGIQPPGDKVLMSTSCHFGHLLLVSNQRQQ